MDTQERDYASAVHKLLSLQSNADVLAKLSGQRHADREQPIEDMRRYLRLLEMEEAVQRLPVIHVAGTKGKGSTCAMVQAILRAHRLRTGLFTSPHMVSPRERFRIDGAPISEELFAQHFWRLYERLERAKTAQSCAEIPFYFKYLTLMCFQLFLSAQVDVVILEVGIGGRADATNVIDAPVVCGISSLGYDHMNVLGHTIAEIAYEKAGICKKNVPLVTVQHLEDGLEVIKRVAKERQVEFVDVVDALDDSIELGLDGKHQRLNAALAVRMCELFLRRQSAHHRSLEVDCSRLPPEFLEGLGHCKWPGRCEITPLPSDGGSGGGTTLLFLDGAHTQHSIKLCTQWFAERSRNLSVAEERPVRALLFTCTSARDPTTLLVPLFEPATTHYSQFEHVFLTTTLLRAGASTDGNRRTMKPPTEEWNRLQRAAAATAEGTSDATQPSLHASLSMQEAIDDIYHLRKSLDNGRNGRRPLHILVCGSLYLVGGIMELLHLTVQ